MEALLLAADTTETEDEFQVWPENWPVWELYRRVATQWRYSWSGPTGLDYSAVYPLIDRLNLSRKDWDLMLHDLQAVEVAARDALQGKANGN